MVSKEGGLVLNNLLLVTATATVFLGTFYPLILDAFANEKISVGAPYFDASFAPIMLVLIAFMGVGPLVKWRKDMLASVRKHLLVSVILIAVVTGMVAYFGASVLGGLSIGLAAYLAFSTLVAFGHKIGVGQAGANRKNIWMRLKAQPGTSFGFLFAHLGIAMTLAGITAMSVWAVDEAKVLNIGESLDVGGYTLRLDAVTPGQAANYQFLNSEIRILKKDIAIGTLRSERRFYPVRGMVTTEAGIRVRMSKNIYAGIGDGDAQKGWVVRAYIHPMVNWIWLGSLLVALAGFVSLIGRKRQ
jgi:cytochrome c-type biogenesis protein CcmF